MRLLVFRSVVNKMVGISREESNRTSQGGGQEKSYGHDDDISQMMGKWTDHPVFFQLLFFFHLNVRHTPQFFPIFSFFPPLFQTPTPLLILNVIIFEVFRTPPHLLGTGECFVVSCISTNMHI